MKASESASLAIAHTPLRQKGLRSARTNHIPWAKMATVSEEASASVERGFPANGLTVKAHNTLRSSQAVPHPSTSRALQRLASEFEWDLAYSLWYGREQPKLLTTNQSLNEWGWPKVTVHKSERVCRGDLYFPPLECGILRINSPKPE